MLLQKILPTLLISILRQIPLNGMTVPIGINAVLKAPDTY